MQLTSPRRERIVSRLSRPLAHRIRSYAALALVVLVVVPNLGAEGCALFSGGSTQGLDYSASARENYEKALAELKRENWLDAIKLFDYTKAKFGFSKWATLAELGVADANFGRQKYADAIDGYRSFIKNHPTHEKVQDGYAEFRIGEAYYKQIPSEWFLVPAAYEKDQGPVRDALRELHGFVLQYRDSPYVGTARKYETDCLRRLADHELYVAGFYLRRKKPLAAIGRLQGLARDYPNSKLEPEALLMLGKTYLLMEKPDEARRAFSQLVSKHPDDYHAQKAKLYLANLDERFGPAKVEGGALPPPAPAPAPMSPGTSAPNTVPNRPSGDAQPAPATGSTSAPAEPAQASSTNP